MTFVLTPPTLGTCQCGCGKSARRDYLPGHDQRLRSQLEKRVGGLRNLEELVGKSEAYASRRLTTEELVAAVDSLFAVKGKTQDGSDR